MNLKELDCFVLKADLNNIVKKGMIGTVLIIREGYDKVEAEIMDCNYNSLGVFAIPISIIDKTYTHQN